MNTRHPIPALALLVAGSLVACRSADTPDDQVPADDSTVERPTLQDAGFELGSADSAPMAQPVSIPMDVEGQWDSPVDYLLSRYDADGDGRIAREEYDRPDATWTRIDRNGDGFVDVEDYQRRSRDGRGGGGTLSRMEEMRRMRAMPAIATYFQEDDDPSKLTLAELKSSADAYDTNSDDVVDEEEFGCGHEERKQELPEGSSMGRRMGHTEPWDAILAAVDLDASGTIASGELEFFFTENDSNKDGVWSFQGRAPASGRTRQASSAGAPERRGAPAGELAPDFTLTSPDGSETATLSSFAGKKPVALIFGSYT